jgi:hypothetical protein
MKKVILRGLNGKDYTTEVSGFPEVIVFCNRVFVRSSINIRVYREYQAQAVRSLDVLNAKPELE